MVLLAAKIMLSIEHADPTCKLYNVKKKRSYRDNLYLNPSIASNTTNIEYNHLDLPEGVFVLNYPTVLMYTLYLSSL